MEDGNRIDPPISEIGSNSEDNNSRSIIPNDKGFESHIEGPLKEENDFNEYKSDILERIKDSFDEIPVVFRDSPDTQEKLLNQLMSAYTNLTDPKCDFKKLIESRRVLALVDSEAWRMTARKRTLMVVVLIIYVAGILVGLAYFAGFLSNLSDLNPEELNNIIYLGIPIPVWIWSVIGSLTSMLLRAWQTPFVDMNEAKRWLLSRPVVGVVMGLIAYLLVITGLIVMVENPKVQAPELIWVIAFFGSFSDTLSINLLQRILGKFEPLPNDEVDETPK